MVLNEQQNLKDSASAKSIIFLSTSKSVNQRRMLSIVTKQEGILYAHASIWAAEVPQSDHRGIFYELFTFSTSICRLFSGAE